MFIEISNFADFLVEKNKILFYLQSAKQEKDYASTDEYKLYLENEIKLLRKAYSKILSIKTKLIDNLEKSLEILN